MLSKYHINFLHQNKFWLPAREHRTRQKALLQIPAILAAGAFCICRIGSLKKIVLLQF